MELYIILSKARDYDQTETVVAVVTCQEAISKIINLCVQKEYEVHKEWQDKYAVSSHHFKTIEDFKKCFYIKKVKDGQILEYEDQSI